MQESNKYYKPDYDFCEINKELLNQGQLKIKIGENIYTGEGKIFLSFLHRSGIYIEGKFNNISRDDMMKLFPNKEVDVSVIINDIEIPGFITAQKLSSFEPNVYELVFCPYRASIQRIGDQSTLIKRIPRRSASG